MKQEELRQTLTEFAAERVALLERHEAGARHVAHYDFNNAYQYVISREETHLQWLQTALAEFEDALPPPSTKLAVPDSAKSREKDVASQVRAICDDDARQLGAFIDRWRVRIASMTHARHRKMLDVILGESREHERFFEQAAAGMEDLLGRRTGGVPRRGSVLPARWLE
jgi:hypothetical protein